VSARYAAPVLSGPAPGMSGRRRGVKSGRGSAAMIDFDLNGRKVAIDETTVRRLRANAKSAAGSSSTLNDLAVILERALTERKPVTLRRAEARALQRLIDQDGSAPARP
jgi:hypothetical protein